MSFSFNILPLSESVVRIDLFGRLLARDEANDLMIAADNQLSSGNNRFVINLSDLAFVNSAGLSSLILLLTKARKNNGEVVIFGSNKRLEELIILTKLNTVFSIFKTESEAIEAIKE